MRKVWITVLSMIIILVFIITYYTLHGRQIRQTELNNAVVFSMERAMEQLLLKEGMPETEEEWIQMFLQSLAVQIDSNSELTVRILEADMDKGLLSVEAILTFFHPLGKTGSVSCYRTVILENYIVSANNFVCVY